MELCHDDINVWKNYASSILLLLLSHFPYAFFEASDFFFLLMDPLDIW
jgi:hypothetical protein